MQKILIVCLAIFALAQCRPEGPEVAIVRSTNDQEVDGSYTFGFEGSDGTSRDEVGRVIPINDKESSLQITGSYKYTDPETGTVYEVSYTADENGFVPVGSHIAESISKAAKAARDYADKP